MLCDLPKLRDEVMMVVWSSKVETMVVFFLSPLLCLSASLWSSLELLLGYNGRLVGYGCVENTKYAKGRTYPLTLSTIHVGVCEARSVIMLGQMCMYVY